MKECELHRHRRPVSPPCSEPIFGLRIGYFCLMVAKFLLIEDLTQAKIRDHTLNVELRPEEFTVFQAAANKRGVSLEEYVRWKLLTAAAVVEVGGTDDGQGSS